MSEGATPAKKAVNAEQHFTQPPPRFSEASLVKRMEELGIGRPSTYASVIQVLKDRAYVRIEKNRFFAEESGRLLTAFLERFFQKYVNYDFTAELEEELDDVSGGRAQWQAVLEAFWKDFKPRTADVMEQKPSDITAALDEFLAPYLFPKRRTAAIRGPAPIARAGGWRCAAASSARSSPAPTIPSANIPAASPSRAGKRARAPGRRRWATIPTPGCRSSASRGGSGRTSSLAKARKPRAPRSRRTSSSTSRWRSSCSSCHA
jgi:hypothetical protein